MNKIITVDNKYSQFVASQDSYFNAVKKLLSYKEPGVEYTPAYRNGWNGIIYLMDKNGYFLSGLQSRVEEFLKDMGIPFTKEDKRKDISNENPPLDISHNLKKLNLIPRDYQERIVESCVNNPKGIIRAATGSGKSLVSALIAAKFNKPTIIYVIGLDLLGQFHKLFSSIFDEEIGFIGNGVCNPKRITIASIWTVGRALNPKLKHITVDDELDQEIYNENSRNDIIKCIKNAKIHMIDECHVVTCETVNIIYKNIDPERVYGLSGTPYREDGSDLLIEGILGKKICDVSASELIEKKVLVQPIIKFIYVPKMTIHAQNYQAVYKNYVVENDIRNNLILKHTKILLEKGYQTMVLFKQISHGKELSRLFEENGVEHALLCGNDKLELRQEVKERLLAKELNLLIASTIADIGLDIPTLSGLVLAGGGKSNIKVYQRIGRVIRGNPGKKYAAVVDFYDDVRYLKNHSVIRQNLYESESGFKVIPCNKGKI
jgi:superfamily II DNA or RNA helicase